MRVPCYTSLASRLYQSLCIMNIHMNKIISPPGVFLAPQGLIKFFVMTLLQLPLLIHLIFSYSPLYINTGSKKELVDRMYRKESNDSGFLRTYSIIYPSLYPPWLILPQYRVVHTKCPLHLSCILLAQSPLACATLSEFSVGHQVGGGALPPPPGSMRNKQGGYKINGEDTQCELPCTKAK